jgi:hypothetical protein
MTDTNDDISLEAVAADVRKVGEQMLMQVKAADTPPEEVRSLRACGSGLIEESYEVANVLIGGAQRASLKAQTLAIVYRDWRAANPRPNSPFPPRTPTS